MMKKGIRVPSRGRTRDCGAARNGEAPTIMLRPSAGVQHRERACIWGDPAGSRPAAPQGADPD